MADYTLDPKEFAKWVPVKQALGIVRPLTTSHPIDVLVGRIRAGSILLAVREAVEIDSRGSSEREAFSVFLSPPWIDYVEDRFWDIGDHTVRVARDSVSYSGTRVKTEILGARLDPDSLEELRLELGGAPVRPLENQQPKSRSEKLPPLSAATRHRFAKLYAEVFGREGTEAGALDAVRACYPKNSVGRDPFLDDFRAIRGEQKRGPKGKSG